MDSIGKGRGGLTKAAFKRFRLASVGKRSILATVAYQPYIRQIFDELKTEGMLPPHAELLNFHDDLRQNSRTGSQTVDAIWSDWETDPKLVSVTETFPESYIRRFFHAGAFVGLACRGKNHKLRYVDCHDPNRPWVRLYRDFFWLDGTLARRDHFDETGAARYRTYIDTAGHPYISSWMTPGGYEYRAVEYSDEGMPTLFNDLRFANSSWLARKLEALGPCIVFTDEPRTSFALEINSPSVHHITSIHTTHFKNNTDRSEGLKGWMTHYLKFKDNVADFVLFTEAQRLDFIQDTNVPEDRVSVVSHAAPTPVKNATVPVSPVLVSVGRLADEKRLEDAIRAFVEHCTDIPSARFKIFGAGPAHERLRNLVGSLNASDLITFEGLTDNPLGAFAEATCSVVASKHEGFGLVITESFAMGTPVVAYDVIYGPQDLITDEVNGLLVPSGDVDALGRAMRRVLTDNKLQAALQTGAIETAGKYSEENWERTWGDLIASADKSVSGQRKAGPQHN